MRIISQNGEVDLPYEMTALFAYDNRVEAVFSGSIQKSPYVMAMYENKEKCQKAMKMLDNTYTGLFFAENIEMDAKSMNEMYKSVASKGFGIITARVNSPEMEFKPANIVFRFPEDNEI